MRTLILELRDRATFIPIVAIDMNPSSEVQRYLLRRAGYACDNVPIIMLLRADSGGKSHYDPYVWGDRTFHVAHLYVQENWETLKDGDVIDVEYILKESPIKKASERIVDFWANAEHA